MTVWAVVYGNYHPPEVVALYDNEAAAQAHVGGQDVGDDLPFEIVRMKVYSRYGEEEG